MDDDDLTEDGFLDGRLRILQPRTGYRAATDPVFLAAAVPAKPGESVLELGVGTGVASLCLGIRVPELDLVGLELQPIHARIAMQNALVNRISLTILEGDVLDMPAALRNRSFDHVIANPPYFETTDVTPPADGKKAVAHVSAPGTLGAWIGAGLRRLAPKGRFTLILRAAALPEALASLQGAADITVLPIASRPGRAPGRVLISARKGGRAPFRLLSPFIVHDSNEHREGDDFSLTARDILRNGLPLKVDLL